MIGRALVLAADRAVSGDLHCFPEKTDDPANNNTLRQVPPVLRCE